MKTLITIEDTYFLISTVIDGHINETMVFKSDENKRILDYRPVFEVKPANHPAVCDYVSIGGLFTSYYEDTICELYDSRDAVLSDFEHTALNEPRAYALECSKGFMERYIEVTRSIRKLENRVKIIDKISDRINKERE